MRPKVLGRATIKVESKKTSLCWSFKKVEIRISELANKSGNKNKFAASGKKSVVNKARRDQKIHTPYIISCS